MISEIKNHKGIIVGIIVVAFLAILGGYFYLHYQTTAKEIPKVMPYSETENPDKIKNTLDVDGKTAVQIVKEIHYIHEGQVAPEATYYVQAPTIQKAADTTAEDIKKSMAMNENPKNLPSAAIEKTDRTVVTADTDQQKVDVYKINLNKQHQIKAGLAQADGHTYAVISYQAGKWEVPIMTLGKDIKGASILYTVARW